MNQKSQILLLQIAKALKAINWSGNNEWELSLKADGNIPFMRSIQVEGRLDNDKWKDQVQTIVRIQITTDDEITFFPEFSLYAQIAIGNIPSEDVEYKTSGNVAFTEKDITHEKKFQSAASEINRITTDYIQEAYQDYVITNEELVKFYKQGNSQPENNIAPGLDNP